MKSVLLVFTVLFMLAGVPEPSPVLAQIPPIQKVRVKIEGVHIHQFIVNEWIDWILFNVFAVKDVKEKLTGLQTKSTALERIESALYSVSGVKKVTIKKRRKWIVIGDYQYVIATIEFVQGELNSETIISAVERASDQNAIFRAKILE
jgi:hypothetical protein